METPYDNHAPQSIQFAVFSAIAVFSIFIRFFWKYFHRAIPRLPFQPKWPNIVIASVQFIVLLVLICSTCSWFYSQDTSDVTNYPKFDEFVNELATKTQSTETSLSTIQYISHYQAIRKHFPKEIFEIRVRHRVMERYRETGLEELEIWRNGTTCETTKEQYEKKLDQVTRDAVNLRDDPIDKTVIAKLFQDWKNVEREVMEDPNYATKMNEEKIRFDIHMKKTSMMFTNFRKMWQAADEIFKSGIVRVTGDKNKEIIFYFGLPLCFAIYFAFWSIICSALLSQYHAPRLWLRIMRTMFYICAVQSIVLSAFKFHQNNTFKCHRYSGEFQLLNLEMPSYQTKTGIKSEFVFLKCVPTGGSIFSNSDIIANPTDFTTMLEPILIKKAEYLMGEARLYDPIVERRKTEIDSIVEALTEVRKSCPEVKNTLNAFILQSNLLSEYLEFSIDVRNAKHSITIPMVRMEQMLSEPVYKFKETIQNGDFDCREIHDKYSQGYYASCTPVNSVVIEHLEMIIIACSSILSICHLFYLRRADHTQFWNDIRVRWANKIFTRNWDEEQYVEWHKVDALNPPDATFVHFSKRCNKEKNRYSDIGLIDQTRVILRDHTTDYIHASWIPVPGTNRKYIATQGPKSNTFPDFWHMVWQENVKIIVMLTGYIEMDRRICDYYVPMISGQTEIYGHIKVVCHEVIEPTWRRTGLWQTIVRTIELIDLSNPDSLPRLSKHVQMTHWFDNTVPNHKDRVVFLHKYIKSLVVDNSPILVHCDTGVARTGTFIAVDITKTLVEQGQYESMVDICHFIAAHRVGAMSKFLDYMFVLGSVLHIFIGELCLFDDDFWWQFKLYQNFINNKTYALENERQRRAISIHYWMKGTDPHWFYTIEREEKDKRKVKKEQEKLGKKYKDDIKETNVKKEDKKHVKNDKDEKKEKNGKKKNKQKKGNKGLKNSG